MKAKKAPAEKVVLKKQNKIEMTLGEVLNGMEHFVAFSYRIDLPASVAYKTSKFLYQLVQEEKAIQQQREKLVKKYDMTLPDQKEKATAEWTDFVNSNKVTFDIEQIPISELKDKDGNEIVISPMAMTFLGRFFKD